MIAGLVYRLRAWRTARAERALALAEYYAVAESQDRAIEVLTRTTAPGDRAYLTDRIVELEARRLELFERVFDGRRG